MQRPHPVIAKIPPIPECQTLKESPRTIEDVQLWIAAHDGRNQALWEAQEGFNKRVEYSMQDFRGRLEALERRVMWIVGAGSVVGAVAGSFAANLLG